MTTQQATETSPFGLVETFVYSQDRKNLLTTLVDDSQERIYYQFIQYQNELESLLKNQETDEKQNEQSISSLLSNIDSLIAKIQKNDSLKNSPVLKKMTDRFYLQIMNYKSMQGWKQEYETLGWKIIKQQAEEFPYDKKPKKKRLVGSNDDLQYPSEIKDFNIKQKIMENYKNLPENNKRGINYNFESDAYTIVVNEFKSDFTKKHVGEVLESSNSIFLHEKELQGLINRDFDENGSSFGRRSNAHQKLTIKQMDKLCNDYPHLLHNFTFLNDYLTKLMPPNLLRYDDWMHDAPLVYKEQYYVVITNFIKTHLVEIKHEPIKAILLHFLLTQQLQNQEMDVNMFVEYLRIPKKSTYNSQIYKYYDKYNNKYFEQKRRINAAKLDAAKKTSKDGESDKNILGGEEILKEINPIGSGNSFISTYTTFGKFPNISNDTDLIKKGLEYLFKNPKLLKEKLSKDLKSCVKKDLKLYGMLRDKYHVWTAEEDKKAKNNKTAPSYNVIKEERAVAKSFQQRNMSEEDVFLDFEQIAPQQQEMQQQFWSPNQKLQNRNRNKY